MDNHQLPAISTALDARTKFRPAVGARNDAYTAYFAGFLSRSGLKNSEIAKALQVQSRDKCSYLIRAGKKLTREELNTWFIYHDRVSLGHMRYLVRLDSPKKRKPFLDELIKSSISVHNLALMIESNDAQYVRKTNVNLNQLTEMIRETTGLDLSLFHSSTTGKGRVVIKYSELSILEDILDTLRAGRAMQRKAAARQRR